MSGWWPGECPEGALIEERKEAAGAATVVPRWLTEDFRGPSPFFTGGVGRVNPIFVDDEYDKDSPRLSFVARPYQSTAPESPGKSGSSGYESNACSDEASSRWEGRSAPRRAAAASRAARRQAHSVRRRLQKEAEATLDPIPEGKVGGLAPRTADPPSMPAFVRRQEDDSTIAEGSRRDGGRRRRPRAGTRDPSPSSPTPSSPASSVSSGSGRRPFRQEALRADAHRQGDEGETSQVESDASSVSSGFSMRRKLLRADGPGEEGKEPKVEDAAVSELLEVVVEMAQEVVDVPAERNSTADVCPLDVCCPNAGTLCAHDVFQKLKDLENNTKEDEGASPWENYYATALPIGRKEGLSVFQGPKGLPSPGGCFGDHLDFTLDIPRAERLMQQIAASKRRRCWGRLLAATLALAFFLVSVVAVSMLYTRGKKVFGPL